MFAFPSMLVPAAEEAGIKVPEFDVDDSLDDIKETHGHFWLFCMVQLWRPMTSYVEHWDNAKVIAKLTDAEVRTVTIGDLRRLGVVGI